MYILYIISTTETFNKSFEDKKPDFDGHVNIALVGKVSSGKSSLLNAILGRRVADVGAASGVTMKIDPHQLDDKVLIIDCPGLDDVRKENSNQTKEFLKSIDLGIFVVTGSADATQKSNFDDLRKYSKNTIVVLNKIDEWDDLEDGAINDVVDQWRKVLGVDKIFRTCVKGYDPKFKKDAPMDQRGIDEIIEAIFTFLRQNKKDILLARHMKDKASYALRIIASSLVAVASEAFIPGSAAYITATQVIAISSLNYLYTGEVLNKSSALALMPSFIGETLGSSLFLLAKSFLPPTGVLDAAAAGIAATVTFAMLAAVKWMLENNHSLTEKDMLKEAFNVFRNSGGELKKISIDDFNNKARLFALLARLMTRAV